MPKIGAKPEPERPFTLRCAVCKHPVQKLVDRFGVTGEPVAWSYLGACRCDCGEPQRQGCVPERVYLDQVDAAGHVDGAPAVRYPIPPATMAEDVWTSRQQDEMDVPYGAPADWPTPPEADKPCAVYGEHRWEWADDDNGHSGDVCACGAYRP